MMNRLSLKTLLIAAMAVLTVCATLQGLVGVLSMRSLVGQDARITTDALPSIKSLSDVRYDMMVYRLRVGRALAVPEAQRAATLAQAQEALGSLNTDLKTYKALIATDDEQKIFGEFQEAWGRYLAIEAEALEAARKGDVDGANGILNAKALPLAQKAQASIQAAVDINTRDADDAAAASARAASVGETVNIAMLVLGLVIGTIAMLLVRSRVVLPLQAITAAMKALAAGKLDEAIPHADRQDEIGAMAAAVQVFKDNAVRVKALEDEERRVAGERARRAENMVEVVGEVGEVVRRAADGDFSARLKVATDDPEMRKLVDGINEINRVVDEATAEFADVLGRVAQGDLTLSVPTAHRGRFGELKDALNATVERLSETVSTIQTTAVDVGTAAREINSGANDLSGRTEQQASSLEETAATAEELAASVKASAQSSRQAVELANEAMGVAADGGRIVREAVEAMARIEQASQKISDITGVIDEIAFQTNLLALNAAVEAARAGDAGKGFAVVASEVRTLAQRSSEAAKDITGLITASGQEVGQGVKLVRGAGEVLEKIVQASRKVSETVSDISSATGEQANGIDELTQAVAHMDQMTQQNAALAEESAASASALSDQIQRLNELASAFRTRGMAMAGSRAVAAPRAAAAGRAQASPVASRPAATPPRRMAAKAAATPSAAAPAPSSEPDRLRQLAAEAFAGGRTTTKAPAAPRRASTSAGGWEEF